MKFVQRALVALVAFAAARRRARRLSGPSDHVHRAVGRRRRHRRHRALLRDDDGEGTGPAGQRRQPHRRQRRRRPQRDRAGARRRLHDRHDHRRDHDDALAGPDRPRPAVATRRSRSSTPIRPASRCAPIRRTSRSRKCSTPPRPIPGKLKASGTGQGGIWHLALAGLLNDLKIPQTAIPWVPSNGAAPAMQDLVAGGVDIVHVLAARSARADRRRQGEAARGDGRQARGAVPRTCRRCSRRSAATTRSPRGAASPAPKGLPPDVHDKLIATIKKIAESKEWKDFAASKGYGTAWAPGAEFAAFMAKGDAGMGGR